MGAGTYHSLDRHNRAPIFGLHHVTKSAPKQNFRRVCEGQFAQRDFPIDGVHVPVPVPEGPHTCQHNHNDHQCDEEIANPKAHIADDEEAGRAMTRVCGSERRSEEDSVRGRNFEVFGCAARAAEAVRLRVEGADRARRARSVSELRAFGATACAPTRQRHLPIGALRAELPARHVAVFRLAAVLADPRVVLGEDPVLALWTGQTGFLLLVPHFTQIASGRRRQPYVPGRRSVGPQPIARNLLVEAGRCRGVQDPPRGSGTRDGGHQVFHLPVGQAGRLEHMPQVVVGVQRRLPDGLERYFEAALKLRHQVDALGRQSHEARVRSPPRPEHLVLPAFHDLLLGGDADHQLGDAHA
mmetsp:Transcript_135291/g.431979  ORF Transcript_135291/g.431979 Transcript_135291/m.431979 type:complete len:355 (+) Transcript_135291:2303-3367(+)